jgi:ubiquinone/menaquinone biosynthesis C-methylase UbiE
MPWFDSEANLAIFFKLLAPGPGERILDVGAGRGILADKVRTTGSSEVYAADPDSARVAKMQETYPSLKSCLANSESLPYPDSYFDKVYSTLAMHHFSDQRRSIQEFTRVLKPMGLLLIVEIRPRSAQGVFLRLFENGIMRSHLKFLEMNRLAEALNEQGRLETEATTTNSFVYFVQSRRRT